MLSEKVHINLPKTVNGSTGLRKILKSYEKIIRAIIDFQLVAVLLLNIFSYFDNVFAFLRVTLILFLLKSISLLPSSGLLSVTGIIAETMFKNIVKLSRIVTPGKLCSLKTMSWWCCMIIFICSIYKCLLFLHGYDICVKQLN